MAGDFYYEYSVDTGGVQVEIYGDDSRTIYYEIFIRPADQSAAASGYPKWVEREGFQTSKWCSLDEGEYIRNVGWNTTGSGSVTWMGASDSFYIEAAMPPPTQRGYINDYSATKT